MKLRCDNPRITFGPRALDWHAGSISEALFNDHPVDVGTEFFAKNRMASETLNLRAMLGGNATPFFAPLPDGALGDAESACKFGC